MEISSQPCQLAALTSRDVIWGRKEGKGKSKPVLGVTCGDVGKKRLLSGDSSISLDVTARRHYADCTSTIFIPMYQTKLDIYAIQANLSEVNQSHLGSIG
eukprot:scaffold7349_cov129-Skeletonema_dohrnii-CCMP3373.AAC.8